MHLHVDMDEDYKGHFGTMKALIQAIEPNKSQDEVLQILETTLVRLTDSIDTSLAEVMEMDDSHTFFDQRDYEDF